MRVPLRGLHLLEAPLILLDHRRLVRNHDVGVDRNRKVEAHKIAQYPRKGGIGQILQSDERVQKTTDSDVRLFLVLNVCIDDLLPCAAMLERGLRPAKGIRSNTNGFRERFTSRKISASVSRRTPIPVALNVCSTPESMDPNSDRISSCSRAVRWMHLFADRLKLSRLKRLVTALPKAAPGSS